MKPLAVLVLVAGLLAVFPRQAYADDTGRFMRGFSSLTTAAFELPYQLLYSTFNDPIPFGIVNGVVRGTVNTATKVVGGIFDMGAAAAPYAKYAVFL